MEKITLARKIFCNILGWHTPSETRAWDGLTHHSICKRCGKHIALDSQGNWFEI